MSAIAQSVTGSFLLLAHDNGGDVCYKTLFNNVVMESGMLTADIETLWIARTVVASSLKPRVHSMLEGGYWISFRSC